MDMQSIYPLIVGHGFKSNADGFSFLLQGKEVQIEGADDVLSALLPQCNGFNSIEKIATSIGASMEYDAKEIEQLIAVLFEHGILIDAREYYMVFHGISANPMLYFREVSGDDLAAMFRTESHLVQSPYGTHTPLEKILELRASTREFSGEPFSKKEFLRLAWTVYGKTERSKMFPDNAIGLGTVPSGGALYSLRVYGIALNVSPLERNGVYKFGPQGSLYLRTANAEELIKIFGEHPTFEIENAAMVLALACNFRQTTQKYSNRGYRYALMEAGHAAQNAYLWCAEQGLGVVEVGGFNDEELAKTLQLPYPQQAPLITLIIGRRKS